MTEEQIILSALLLAEIVVCVRAHCRYREYLRRMVAAWLERRTPARRQLRPNSPKDCLTLTLPVWNGHKEKVEFH
jgi:hypothetical protein